MGRISALFRKRRPTPVKPAQISHVTVIEDYDDEVVMIQPYGGYGAIYNNGGLDPVVVVDTVVDTGCDTSYSDSGSSYDSGSCDTGSSYDSGSSSGGGDW